MAGEHVWPLGPLHDEGPALFVERARAAEPRVHWDPADPAVIELCRRLDDVPLALELAAGQLRRFDLDELNRRLDDRLALLCGRRVGRRAAPRDDGDGDRLELPAARASRAGACSATSACSPSSFDVGAVEASAPPLPSTAPVAVFGQLVDKSLVVRLPGSGRYRLLETIRVFARDRLEESRRGDRGLRAPPRATCGTGSVRASRLDRWMSARLGRGVPDATSRTRGRRSGSAWSRASAADAVEIAIGASFLWRNAIGCAEGDAWVQRAARPGAGAPRPAVGAPPPRRRRPRPRRSTARCSAPPRPRAVDRPRRRSRGARASPRTTAPWRTSPTRAGEEPPGRRLDLAHRSGDRASSR